MYKILDYDDEITGAGLAFIDGPALLSPINYKDDDLFLFMDGADDHGDDIATATDLPLDGMAIAGRIDSPDDLDYFTFTVEAGDVLNFNVSTDNFQFDAIITIRDADDRDVNSLFILAQIPGTPPEAIDLRHTFSTAGTYYAVVEGVGDSNFDYDIAARYLEDRGDTSTATDIPTDGTLITGSIENDRDVDYYAFTVEAGQIITFNLSSDTGANLNSRLRIRDINEDAVEGASRTNRNDSSTLLFEIAGTYYVGVAGPALDYNLTVTFVGSKLDGTPMDDVLNGSDGDDILNGMEGSDTLNGGAGDDTLIYQDSHDGRGNQDVDTLNGGSGDDIFIVELYYKLGLGLGTHVIVNGGDGDDTIEIDTTRGGNTFTFNGGDGYDQFRSKAAQENSYILDAGAGGASFDIGRGNFDITFGSGRDFIEVYAIPDSLIIHNFQTGNDGDRLYSDTRQFVQDLFNNPDGIFQIEQRGADTVIQIDLNGLSDGPTFQDYFTLTDTVATDLTPYNLPGIAPARYTDGADIVSIGLGIAGAREYLLLGGDDVFSSVGNFGSEDIGSATNLNFQGQNGPSVYGGDGNDDFTSGRFERLYGGDGDDVFHKVYEDGFMSGGDGNDTFILDGSLISAGPLYMDMIGADVLMNGGNGNDSLIWIGDLVRDSFFFRSCVDCAPVSAFASFEPTFNGGDGNDSVSVHNSTTLGTSNGGSLNFILDMGTGDDNITITGDVSDSEDLAGDYTITFGDGFDQLSIGTLYAAQTIIITDFIASGGSMDVISLDFAAFIPQWDGTENPFLLNLAKLETRDSDVVLLMNISETGQEENWFETILFQDVNVDTFVYANFGFGGVTRQGDNANNSLIGTQYDDTLNGLDGDDILDGGLGNDTLSGGAGADSFVFGPESARDIITDFNQGDDKIILDYGPYLDWNDIQSALRQDGANAVLDLENGTSIQINGVQASNLSLSDFIIGYNDPDGTGPLRRDRYIFDWDEKTATNSTKLDDILLVSEALPDSLYERIDDEFTKADAELSILYYSDALIV